MLGLAFLYNTACKGKQRDKISVGDNPPSEVGLILSIKDPGDPGSEEERGILDSMSEGCLDPESLCHLVWLLI